MNTEEFKDFLKEYQEKYQEEYIDVLAEESNIIEDNSSYDGDWTNEVEKIYRYNKNGLDFVFKHSYSESSAGCSCDTWNENIILLENYDDGLNKKVDIIYRKIEDGLKLSDASENIPVDKDYSYLKNIIKEALKEII